MENKIWACILTSVGILDSTLLLIQTYNERPISMLPAIFLVGCTLGFCLTRLVQAWKKQLW